MQVIHQDRIAKFTARSVTELLNENAVGFMSEWTPGQTSINIRGAATEGQGRDFKSQVLVLINGHRAGTANTSKLSSADIERIEIVRGPSSVIYGSQNMGGVINIILKTGLTAPGNVVDRRCRLVELCSRASSLSFWILKGLSTGTSAVPPARATTMRLGRRRRGAQHGVDAPYRATGAFGYPDRRQHKPRRGHGAVWDGIYNAGFRGSSANLFAFDYALQLLVRH